MYLDFSTQDTVVALQALATFESYQHQGPLMVTASVTAEGLTHSFNVNDDNSLLQQLVSLPTLPTNVTLSMEGEGCAILQVTTYLLDPQQRPYAPRHIPLSFLSFTGHALKRHH